MRIGNFESKNNVFLAPMAGVTDKVFRQICRKEGAGLCYTEMVSAKGLIYGSENTKKLLAAGEDEDRLAVQLFGSDPDVLSEAMKMLESDRVALFDINMGCPAPKIVRNGEGSALMQNPALIEKIVGACSRAVKTPVTVKIRKGFDRPNAPECAKAAENGGAAAITVHGRMRYEYYGGSCDMDIIKEVKQTVSIPVIGNGDITDGVSAKRMLEYTGCDGIMIGRGAWGNPFIFREITTFLETGGIPPKPTCKERLEAVLAHLNGLVEFKGEYSGVREMRTHSGRYIKGLSGAAAARTLINRTSDKKELENILTEIFSEKNNYKEG